MLCPANIATGGTESIHKFANELNKSMPVRILYVGNNLSNPQPEEYHMYNCKYITEFPADYHDVVIFPEIWGNQVLEEKYRNCIKVINWAGVDVYYWHNRGANTGLFLQDKSVLHLAQSVYAENHLEKLGIHADRILKLSDVLNDAFFENYEEQERNDVVLYNPAKITDFERKVIYEASKQDIQFKEIKNLSRENLIKLLRTTKLYIDFGVFSGRERIPREAAMCGCCVLTSNLGAAGYYDDVVIADKYKFAMVSYTIPSIIEMMKSILQNYDAYKNDFNAYRESLIHDRDSLKQQCEIIAKRLLETRNENSGV